MIDRVQRAPGYVESVVVVVRGVLVRRLAGVLVLRHAPVVGGQAMIVMPGEAAEPEVRSDPRQCPERWNDQRRQRERRDESTPARAPAPPASG